MLYQWYGHITVWCGKINYNSLHIHPPISDTNVKDMKIWEQMIDDVTFGKYQLCTYVFTWNIGTKHINRIHTGKFQRFIFISLTHHEVFNDDVILLTPDATYVMCCVKPDTSLWSVYISWGSFYISLGQWPLRTYDPLLWVTLYYNLTSLAVSFLSGYFLIMFYFLPSPHQ